MTGRRAADLAFLGALAAVALSAAGHLLDLWLFDLRVQALNSDANWSLSDSASFVAIVATLIGAIVIAAGDGRNVAASFALVAVLAFILFDDGTQLHERFGSLWQVVYLPVLGPAFLLLWWAARRPAYAARLTRVGLACLAVSVFSGYAVEQFVSEAYWARGQWPYETKIALKQGLELGGWVLIAAGIAAAGMRTKVSENLWRKNYAKHHK